MTFLAVANPAAGEPAPPADASAARVVNGT